MDGRTIHLVSQVEVDMSATTGVTFEFGSGAAANNVSDAEVEELLDIGTEVEIFVVDNNTTRQGGVCSCLVLFIHLTLFNLETYGSFQNTDRHNYTHHCLCLALKAGGLSNIKKL